MLRTERCNPVELRLLNSAAIIPDDMSRKICDTSALAEAIQVAYNGTLISWAIFRQGPLGAALRGQLEFVLRPFRSR